MDVDRESPASPSEACRVCMGETSVQGHSKVWVTRQAEREVTETERRARRGRGLCNAQEDD